MSEPKKYVTFRDLKDLTKQKLADSIIESPTSSTSSTSSPSTTSATSSTSSSSTTSTSIQAKKQRNQTEYRGISSVAPERDFQRVPNSVIRQALQDGLFRGKSKQVWDYLWSVSRGAVLPTRIVRKSRREIKAGAGLGSMVTVDAAIEHLTSVGLIAVKPAIGSLIGNEYEVFTPEESAGRTTRYTSTSSISSLTQNLVHLDIPETSITSIPLTPLDSTKSEQSNTLINTDDDDDTHTLLIYFTKTLIDGAKELVGGNLADTEKERELWNECACVLIEELKKAAENTKGISSVPAFLAAHLRRRFADKQKTDNKTIGQRSSSKLNRETSSVALQQSDITARPRDSSTTGSKHSIETCRHYAEYLQKTGQGITNPGGYATTIYRTGEADDLIDKFLNPDAIASGDESKCFDCKGVGFLYPEGIERGIVTKCKHLRLSTALSLKAHIDQLRQLHDGDAGYQLNDLLDDLKFRCGREKIDWDEELVNWLLDS